MWGSIVRCIYPQPSLRLSYPLFNPPYPSLPLWFSIVQAYSQRTHDVHAMQCVTSYPFLFLTLSLFLSLSPSFSLSLSLSLSLSRFLSLCLSRSFVGLRHYNVEPRESRPLFNDSANIVSCAPERETLLLLLLLLLAAPDVHWLCSGRAIMSSANPTESWCSAVCSFECTREWVQRKASC